MKKKIILSTLVFCFIGLNVFFALNDVKSDSSWTSILGMKQAMAEEEGGGGALWTKTTSDCSITLNGSAGTTVKLFGVPYTIPVEGELTLTFSDIATDCAAGGNNMCEYYTCATFWKGSED